MAILDLQCGRRYRSFGRYLEHSSVHGIGRTDLEAATVTGSPGEGFWWRRAEVPHWLLVHQPMTVGGEIPRPGERILEREYSEERGAHVLRSQDVNDTLAVCDLCGAKPVRWGMPARRFIGPAGGMMGGPTAVCEACHILLERGDRQRIVKRVLRRLGFENPRLAAGVSQMLGQLIDNITGVAIEIGT